MPDAVFHLLAMAQQNVNRALTLLGEEDVAGEAAQLTREASTAIFNASGARVADLGEREDRAA